jgi:hypothetical protein
MTSLSSWLASVGRQAIVSETGTANNAGCISKLSAELKYISSVPNTIAGFTAWSAGAFDPSYLLSLTPSGNSDSELPLPSLFPLYSLSSTAADFLVSSLPFTRRPRYSGRLPLLPRKRRVPAGRCPVLELQGCRRSLFDVQGRCRSVRPTSLFSFNLLLGPRSLTLSLAAFLLLPTILQHHLFYGCSCSQANHFRRRLQARHPIRCSLALARPRWQHSEVHRSCRRRFRSCRHQSVLLLALLLLPSPLHLFLSSSLTEPDPQPPLISRRTRLRRRNPKRLHHPLGRSQLQLRQPGPALPGRLQRRQPIVLDGVLSESGIGLQGCCVRSSPSPSFSFIVSVSSSPQ